KKREKISGGAARSGGEYALGPGRVDSASETGSQPAPFAARQEAPRPAPGARSARRGGFQPSLAGRPKEPSMRPLLSLLLSRVLCYSPRSSPPSRHRREARRRSTPRRLHVEALEDRTVPTAVAAPSGLVSWWTGNNTAADVLGAHNGTLVGGTTFSQ